MTYRVVVTGPAKHDIRSNLRWWAENRSAEEANRWFLGIEHEIASLQTMPLRHSLAEEAGLMVVEIRQMPFGLGRRPSHRVLYAVKDDEVIVYRVRAIRQSALSLEELQG
ncbi:Plasmid stabilization system protein [Pseudobythopirellula maris]|uniref:Plasmid stabilization system protein n=1 Tax=Pseudobythopirellula maris TaxID=2527991 RepID=A0A5C5ZNQ8_9BACT|nr:type II toxin-antitoxin system RelE/ParE family toxin [Pseudobythopirellula maris]TWT88547.1 Plasmid stabilization system protein [Pseudobythopirellula maris]